MSKKLCTVLFAVLLAFAFAACGGDDNGGGKSSASGSSSSGGNSSGGNSSSSSSSGGQQQGLIGSVTLPATPSVLITYVYGGASNSSAPAAVFGFHPSAKFIQLKNVSDAEVDLSSWSLQFKNQTTSTDLRIVSLSPNGSRIRDEAHFVNASSGLALYDGKVPSGKSVLIGYAPFSATEGGPIWLKGAGGPGNFVMADLSAAHNEDSESNIGRYDYAYGWGGTGIALVKKATAITGASDPDIVDAVGYKANTAGSNARDPGFWAGTSPIQSENMSTLRRKADTSAPSGFKNTGVNTDDFEVVGINGITFADETDMPSNLGGGDNVWPIPLPSGVVLIAEAKFTATAVSFTNTLGTDGAYDATKLVTVLATSDGGSTSKTITYNANYISATGWDSGAITDNYWEITLFAGDYSDLLLDFGTYGSNTGPKGWQIMYSYAGAAFANISDTKGAITVPAASNHFIEEIGIPSGSGLLKIRIQLVDRTQTNSSNTAASTGTNRIAQFKLIGKWLP